MDEFTRELTIDELITLGKTDPEKLTRYRHWRLETIFRESDHPERLRAVQCRIERIINDPNLTPHNRNVKLQQIMIESLMSMGKAIQEPNPPKPDNIHIFKA